MPTAITIEKALRTLFEIKEDEKLQLSVVQQYEVPEKLKNVLDPELQDDVHPLFVYEPDEATNFLIIKN